MNRKAHAVILVGACVSLSLAQGCVTADGTRSATAVRSRMTDKQIFDRECEYISGLINLGFSDFVPMVEEGLGRRGIAGVSERLIGLRAKSFVLRQEYDEAEDELNKLSKSKLASWKAYLATL